MAISSNFNSHISPSGLGVGCGRGRGWGRFVVGLGVLLAGVTTLGFPPARYIMSLLVSIRSAHINNI